MQFYKNLVFIVGAAMLLFGSTSTVMNFITTADGVLLTCEEELSSSDGQEINKLSITLSDSTSGNYSCDNEFVYVYVSTRKNSMTLDTGGICGLIVASVTSTIFIGLAVYSLSAQNKSRTYQASDRHPLMRNDANEAVYSHLSHEGKSTYSELGKKRFR